MSSTNRGGKRSEADDYPTPRWCATRILEDPFAQLNLPGGRWLEPGAGEGNLIRAVNAFRSDVEWTGVELRESCREPLAQLISPDRTIIGSYLDWVYDGPKFDVAFGNPPYWLAEDFLALAMKHARNVCLLLRVNFYASHARQALMRELPADLYVLPNRPSFRGAGTDSPEYAWFVWPEERREYGRIRVLETTPLEERRAEKAESQEIVRSQEGSAISTEDAGEATGECT